MVLGSKALARLYLGCPIGAETFPKLHLKARPLPAGAGAILVAALPQSTGLQIPGLASAGSDFPQPPHSSEGRAVQPPPPPQPTPLHSFIPEALEIRLSHLLLAVKHQRVPKPQPDSRENQKGLPNL